MKKQLLLAAANKNEFYTQKAIVLIRFEWQLNKNKVFSNFYFVLFAEADKTNLYTLQID